MADGRILTGEQALNAGLIDATGSYDDAIAKAGELAGIKNPNPVEYAVKEFSFFDVLTQAGYNLGFGLQKGVSINTQNSIPAIRN